MIIVVFISFIMSIFVAIQDPIIQKFAIRIAGGYISQKTGAEVKIGRLYISPNFTIQIDHFSVKDLKKTDLINVKELKVHPNMEELIHGNIHLGCVELNQTKANLITYEGEDQMNFLFLVDAFSSDEEEEESSSTTTIKVDRVILKDLDFQLWDQNNDDTLLTANHEMDFSHLVLEDINLDVEGLVIIGDSINATIHNLSAKEMSGFALNSLKTNVIVSPNSIMMDSLKVETPNSRLDLDLHMAFNGYDALSNFVDSVRFDNVIRPSLITISDFGPFSQTLYDMTDQIRLEGWMKGPIQSFTVDDIVLAFGDQTQFRGNIALEPLDFEKGKQQLNIKKLNYSYDDLANFHVPTSSGTIPIPTALAPLGKGTIKGNFSGTLDKFKTNLDITSEIGNVSATLERHFNDQHHSVFEGEIFAERLDVGILADASDKIGTVDVNTNVIARLSPSGDLDLDIDGSLSDAMLMGNNINEIALNGNLHKNCFNGTLVVDDDDLEFDFKGRFDFSDPESLGGNFNANIISADLYKLNLVNEETCTIKASITANVKNVNDFDKAEGSLVITDLKFVNSSDEYVLDNFQASIINDNVVQKRININSDILDLKLAGQMDFANFTTTFKQFINRYVAFPQWADELALLEKKHQSPQQDILFDVTIKDPNPITKLLMPDLIIAKNTTLNGTFTSQYRSLNMTIRSKYVKFQDIRIHNIECKSKSYARRLTTNLNIDEIIIRDSTESDPNVIGLDKFLVSASLQNDSILTTISWDDVSADDHNKASILTSLVPKPYGFRFSIDNSDIIVNDSSWTTTKNNYVDIDDDKIRIANLGLLGNNQSLVLDGYAPMTQEDTLTAVLDRFDISTFDFLLKSMGYDLDGYISGQATISDLNKDMTIFADLDVKDFGLDGQPYGDMDIKSQWNNEQSSIDLNLDLINQEQQVVSLSGSYYIERESDNLDFKLALDDLPLGIVSPFVSDLAQRFQGTCKGNLDIKGTLSDLDIQGKVKVNDGGCQVILLNTFYTFSPTITLTDKLITLSDLSLTDTLGNSAMVIGQIKHDHLKDMSLDIRMFPNNFLAMATNAHHSSSYYGTAIANGIVEIKGPIDDLTLNIKARTMKGTSITLPLGGSSSVSKHEFITFISKEEKDQDNEEEEAIASTPQPRQESSNVNINLDVDVNNDAQIKIALPDGLGSMEAKGEGNIKMGMATSDNSLSLVGDYVISAGSLSLNIQDVIKRNFSLDPGSRISWTGDPYNGTINATGVYQTKAPISSLGLIDSTSMGSSNIKVECLVHLKNKLLNPDISFGLRLPNASEDLQQAVFYVIDTTNQSEVLLQVVNLLVFNSFSYGSSVNSFGIITSQMNDFISQFTNDIDINFNYRAGDELNNQEMTVDLKKQLFDDRLTIETNFGVIRPTSSYSSNSTNIIGDVNIDYKITKDGRWSLQGFNRSNYNTSYYQYTYYKMAPYTQGIGISYQKSFDRWRDLFKKQTNINLPNRPIFDNPRPMNKRPNQENHEQPE